MPTCQAYWKKLLAAHNTTAAPWLRRRKGNLKPANDRASVSRGLSITRHFSLGPLENIGGMQPRNDGMAERLKLGRAGPCRPVQATSEYRSAPDGETEYTSRHRWETQQRERATVKDHVASVASEILPDAVSH